MVEIAEKTGKSFDDQFFLLQIVGDARVHDMAARIRLQLQPIHPGSVYIYTGCIVSCILK